MNTSGPKILREGFTTGTAMAAAAAGALTALLGGGAMESLSVPLPPGGAGASRDGRITIPLGFCRRIEEDGHLLGYAGVIKDAGDDPDVTDGMLLTVHAARDAAHFPARFHEECRSILDLDTGIWLYAGPGIGVVTLPGLPVAVGEMAVNPAPRAQIAAALREVARLRGYRGPIHCRLAALEGEERAKRTLNPRLGVTGGISILGTRGTVRPFSTEAWKATIRQAMNVAEAHGCQTVCLTTGRRSEDAMRALFPDLEPQAFIQVADHAGFAVAEAASHGFTRILWGCFPGKLLKLAQGKTDTHARESAPDFSLLTRFCREAGLDAERADTLLALPTVVGALETLRESDPEIYRKILDIMAENAGRTIVAMLPDGTRPEIGLHALDMRGNLLAKKIFT